MSLSKAKADFEAVVKSMQADLQRYVDSGKATQKAVDYRTSMINKLVEFYRIATDEAANWEKRCHAEEAANNKLHYNTERLVYWSRLHRANPNQIFQYDLAELKLMVQQGRRFGRPEDYYFNDDDTAFNNQTNKYLTTHQQCSRK